MKPTIYTDVFAYHGITQIPIISMTAKFTEGSIGKDDYLLSQLHITLHSLPRHLREVQGREERLREAQGIRV